MRLLRARVERKDHERKVEENQEIQYTIESEKEMERQVEATREPIKILNLDIGRKFKESKTLIKEAIKKIQEKVGLVRYHKVQTKKKHMFRILMLGLFLICTENSF